MANREISTKKLIKRWHALKSELRDWPEAIFVQAKLDTVERMLLRRIDQITEEDVIKELVVKRILKNK